MSNTSVRLNNSIVAASMDGKLPFETVEQYIEAGGDAASNMRAAVRNFGSKTSQELEQLIEEAVQGKLISSHTDAPETLVKEQLLGLFIDDSVHHAVFGEVFSTRLEAALSADELQSLSLRDFIDGFDSYLSQMRMRGNFGKASADELRYFMSNLIARRLTSYGYADTLEIANWLLGSVPLALTGALSQFGDPPKVLELSAVERQSHITVENVSLSERLDRLLDELEPRAKMIVQRRNGIGQKVPETLEEIGVTEGVTRERIRQIEAKSLKRMRKRLVRFPIFGLLQEEGTKIFEVLSGEKIWLTNEMLFERRRLLDPYVRLSFQLLDLKLEDWIEAIAGPEEFGWLSKDIDLARFENVKEMLRDLASAPLPRPITEYVGENDKKLANATADIVLNKKIYLGYLMPDRVGARLRRLVRLHAILGMEEFSSVESLVETYHHHFLDDPCNVRDAEIVMQAAQHLFLEVEDGFWTAIGEASSILNKPSRASAMMAQDTVLDPGTIAHALKAKLEENGPTRLVDLMENASQVLPEGRSANSIAPILLTRRDLFVRLLPGVYGLPSHAERFRKELPENWPVLLNEFQARAYAAARYAGEPRSIFPLWTTMAEQAFCNWARHSGTDEVFASLLQIAKVDEWSVGQSQSLEWARLKDTRAQYRLGTALRHQAAYVMPALDRVFAACFHTSHTGSFNWIAANRLIGRKLDSHTGAGLVAILLRLGAIEETDSIGYRWQRSHRATPVARQLYLRLGDGFRVLGGETDWDSPIGNELRDLAMSMEADDWVDNTSFRSMLDLYRLDEQDDDAADDPLEQVLYEQAKIRSIARKEATLDWLLEE